MNLEHIRTFLEVAESGNFNRAAESLHVTQSTVSARNKTLEDYFGLPLFKRARSGVELTGPTRGGYEGEATSAITGIVQIVIEHCWLTEKPAFSRYSPASMGRQSTM